MSAGTRGLRGSSVAILESLYQHRLLSTRQVHDLHTPKATARFAQETLVDLRAASLVDRVVRPGGLGVWFLTSGGIEMVEEIPNRVETRRTSISPERAAGPLQAHTLAVNDVGVGFVRLARERGEEFGPFGWRHEIAHPLTPPGKRQERLIADAILSYQANEKGATRFHYRFIEVDRANRPVDDLAAQIGRYGRLYRRPSNGRHAALHWTRRYRVFPNVLVLLAGRPDPNLERRRATLLALCRADPDLARSPELQVFVCLLPELKRHGPAATIFRTVTEPDRPADWLGRRPTGQGERP
ncbi:MAG TPA: replication-relaxation family protein [Solirubrobacterales bacterium]|nr:replication-relaxation family protein [Solirubrobacterales bacterium]